MPLVRVGMNDALPTVLPAIDKLLLWLRHERHTIKESAQRPRRVLADREADEVSNQSPPAPTYATTSGPARHAETTRKASSHGTTHQEARSLRCGLNRASGDCCVPMSAARLRAGVAADATDYRPTAS
jgi:hypothetical protein